MPKYKVLSLTQPWADLVMLGEKHIETRSWKTDYRGDILIHASKGYPRWARDLEKQEPFSSSLRVDGVYSNPLSSCGHLLCLVRLVDCYPTEPPPFSITEKEAAFGNYGPSRWAWELADVRRLAYRIPARGALGLWEWNGELKLASEVTYA